MVVVGLELDDLAQQPLHLVQPIQLLGHHRLLVQQIDIAGELLIGLREYGVRVLPELHVAQHLRFGEQLGAGVGRRLLRSKAHQFAGFLDLALARQQRGAPGLHFERALRVVDLGEPALGTLEVALLLGGLSQKQPGLRAALLGGRRRRCRFVVILVVGSGCRGGGRRLQLLQIGLERGGGFRRVAQFHVQRTERQPGWCHVGRDARDALQL
jgi:hypothetical protein